MHDLSFVESFLRCYVTCDAKVQLKYQPNLHYCRAVGCDPELWKCPQHCNLESPPVSTPEQALLYCPAPTFLGRNSFYLQKEVGEALESWSLLEDIFESSPV